jgi:hypothetical protein
MRARLPFLPIQEVGSICSGEAGHLALAAISSSTAAGSSSSATTRINQRMVCSSVPPIRLQTCHSHAGPFCPTTIVSQIRGPGAFLRRIPRVLPDMHGASERHDAGYPDDSEHDGAATYGRPLTMT